MLVQVQPAGATPALIDPTGLLDLHPLARALEQVPVVLVHGGQMDVQILNRLTGFVPRAVFDTQVAGGCAGDGWPVRLQELVRRHLGVLLPKTETLSDWSRRPLSPDQVRYAEDDVRVLGPLAAALRKRLAERGNLEVAAACTAEMYAGLLTPPDDSAAWRTVQGAHLLDEGERAVLQDLAEWRERRARLNDIPRYNILSDSMLLDLARRQPGSVDAMRANRRLPSQAWKRDAPEILERIAAGRRAAAPPPLRPQPRVWIETVQAAARIAEMDRGVATELILDEQTLERIYGGSPVEGWRATALGTNLLAFLSGGGYIAMPPALGRFH